MSGPQNVRPKLAGEQALRFDKRRGKSGCKEALARLASLNDRNLVDHLAFPSPHIRLPGFWNLKNFCLWTGILVFGIRNSAQVIKNPSSHDKESRVSSVDSRIQDCLGLAYMGLISIYLTLAGHLELSFLLHLYFPVLF